MKQRRILLLVTSKAVFAVSAAAWGMKEYPDGTFMTIRGSPVEELMGRTRSLSAWPDIYTQAGIMTSYRYLVCGNTDVYKATTTQEVADIILGLKGSDRTIRAISHQLPHSPASFPCASLNTGDPRQVTILLDMPKIITPLDPATGLITVSASMDLFTLGAVEFEAANRTLPNMAWPYHAQLTAGGVFSAGSHGSNMQPGGHFMDMVTCVKYVGASATIKTAGPGCPDKKDPDSDPFRALKAGLGMLGIITELTVQSVPNTKTQVQILYYEDDSNITQAIEAVKRDPTVDNLFAVWRPDVKRMALIVGRTLPYNTPMYPLGAPYPRMPDGGPTGPFCVVTSGLSVKNYTDLVGALLVWNSPGGLFTPVNDYLADLSRYLVAFTWASYVTTDYRPVRLDPIETPLGTDMVGRTNLMSISFPCDMRLGQSGTLCFYADSPDPGLPNLSFKDVEIAIPDTPDNLRSVVADVNRLVAMDLQASVAPEYLNVNSDPKPVVKPHMSLGAGVMFRFSSKSDTILGMNGQGKVMWVGMESFNYLESAAHPYPSRNYYMADVMEQHLVCKYKGRVHWGKNIDRAFLNSNCPLRDNMRTDIDLFTKFQDSADPNRIFEPPLYKMIKAGSAPTYSDQCDVTRKCICTEDRHCVYIIIIIHTTQP